MAGQAGAQAGLEAIATVELSSMSETVLEVIELSERAADEVMGAAPSAREMLGELRERPVLMEVEPAGLALVVGEQGTVDVEQPLLRRPRRQWLGIGSICQGQDLDMLHDRPELTVGRERAGARSWWRIATERPAAGS